MEGKFGRLGEWNFGVVEFWNIGKRSKRGMFWGKELDWGFDEVVVGFWNGGMVEYWNAGLPLDQRESPAVFRGRKAEQVAAGGQVGRNSDGGGSGKAGCLFQPAYSVQMKEFDGD